MSRLKVAILLALHGKRGGLEQLSAGDPIEATRSKKGFVLIDIPHVNPTSTSHVTVSSIMPTDLRVFAGPSPHSLTDISDKVNTDEVHHIVSDAFEGAVSLQIKRFQTLHRTTSSDYFERPDRQGITWSIQVQGLSLPSPLNLSSSSTPHIAV